MLICLREGFFLLNRSLQQSYLLQQESCEDDNDFNINTRNFFFLPGPSLIILGTNPLYNAKYLQRKERKAVRC